VAVRDAALEGEDEKDAAWSFLGDQITRSPFFKDAVVIDSSGTEVTRHASWKPIITNSEQPSWQPAWETGLYVSDVAFISDGVTPLYYLDIAAKIEDPLSKEGLGVVVGTMKLNPQSLGPEYASKVQGNRVVVFDRSGRIITDSGNLQRFQEDKPLWTQDEQMVKNRVTNDAKGIAPGYVITDEAVAGYARATNNDVGIRVTGFEGLGWTVMVEQDAKSAFAALDSLESLKDDLSKNTNNMLITLVVILIVVLIGVPGVAFHLSRGITKPIAQLNTAAEKVSMGDMAVTVDVKSDDEIGDLAKSFGRMIVAVRFLASDQEEEQQQSADPQVTKARI